ncbi:cytochrome c peroxidase [Urechidicola sp. KH5]
MKNPLLYLFLVFGLFSYNNFYFESKEINKELSDNYEKGFINFRNALKSFNNSDYSKNNLPLLKSNFKQVRYAYKEIEFIYDYLQTTYNYYNINGSPLPKYNQSYTRNEVWQPNGLQTIDELLYSDYHQEKLNQLNTELYEKVLESYNNHFPYELNDQEVFEAMRSGLIRIFTHGITGFDTPGSGNGIKESHVALNAIFSYFKSFKTSHSLNDVISKKFTLGLKQLKEAESFNEFNRMIFLKDVINPLFKDLLEYQKHLNISTDIIKHSALNFDVTNIFDIDLINTEYYNYRSYIPLNNEKAITLGEALFFDKNLSNNGQMSCASCHQPEKAFQDGLAKSPTTRNKKTTNRNTPTLINSAYASRQFWDMRAFNLELQVAHVVGNNNEFNTSFKTISNKIKSNPSYAIQFRELYGSIEKDYINQRSISNAIAAYVSSLRSKGSSFDRFIDNKSEHYSEDAIKGFNLFMGKAACATCHFPPTFNGTIPPFYTETESEVLGVTNGLNIENPQLDDDKGRGINKLFRDDHKHFLHAFKTVTLRNIELTAPYMHNGSFETLEEVLTFYNEGGGAGLGIEIPNQTLSSEKLNLSQQEMDAIIVFLKTLTDKEYRK